MQLLEKITALRQQTFNMAAVAAELGLEVQPSRFIDLFWKITLVLGFNLVKCDSAVSLQPGTGMEILFALCTQCMSLIWLMNRW